MKKVLTALIVLLLVLTGAVITDAAEIVANGATDQSFYMVMYDRNGDPNSAITVTTLDMYYVEDGAAVASKIDCTDLGSENAAHSDGGCYEMGTLGLYRFDFPDAAFDGGVGKRVNLCIKDAITGTRAAYLCVQLSPSVNVDAISDDQVVPDTIEAFYDDATAVANKLAFFDGTGLSIATFTTDGMTQANIEAYTQTGCAAAITADAEIDAILADTGELQVDWVNGGRLDLILDIIAADTTTDIPGTISTMQADLDLYDTDAEYATAIWEALIASYGGAGSYGEALENVSAGADAAAIADAVRAEPLTNAETVNTIGWFLRLIGDLSF